MTLSEPHGLQVDDWNEHRGKMMIYLEVIMESQPWRRRADAWLTDTHNIELWSITRENSGYRYQVKDNVSLQDRGERSASCTD